MEGSFNMKHPSIPPKCPYFKKDKRGNYFILTINNKMIKNNENFRVYLGGFDDVNRLPLFKDVIADIARLYWHNINGEYVIKYLHSKNKKCIEKYQKIVNESENN